MTEPVRKYSSPDVPEYSSYPAEPIHHDQVRTNALGEFDALPGSTTSAIYDDRARQIGAALGRLVNRIDELTASARSTVRREVNAQTERLEDQFDHAKQVAGYAYDDASRKVAETTREAVYQARLRAAELRRRTAQTVHDHPVETLAVAGIAGIVAGVGLRAWSESRRWNRG